MRLPLKRQVETLDEALERWEQQEQDRQESLPEDEEQEEEPEHPQARKHPLWFMDSQVRQGFPFVGGGGAPRSAPGSDPRKAEASATVISPKARVKIRGTLGRKKR